MINGLSVGAIYALIALGYTMVYGVLRFINFAHSDVFMVGAYVGFFLAPQFAERSLPGGLAILVGAMVACAVLGVIIERFAYRPLRSSSRLNVLITAIGVSLLIENSAQFFWKANPRSFPAIFPMQTFHLGGVSISSNQVAVLAIAVVLLLGLQFFVMRT